MCCDITQQRDVSITLRISTHLRTYFIKRLLNLQAIMQGIENTVGTKAFPRTERLYTTFVFT